MKLLRSTIFLMLPILLYSCVSGERRQQIEQREAALHQKEEQLILRERQLALQEAALQSRELSLDSTQKQIDSLPLYNPEVAGAWSVKMRCTETSCEGSAIGDVKTERWEIAYDINNEVLIKAFSGKKLIRTYSGLYTKNGLKLVADETPIFVTLSPAENQRMEGTREISRSDCKIIYTLSAEKITEINSRP